MQDVRSSFGFVFHPFIKSDKFPSSLRKNIVEITVSSTGYFLWLIFRKCNAVRLESFYQVLSIMWGWGQNTQSYL